MSIKYYFEAFKRPEYFSRVDKLHILDLYIGLDDKGRKSIELRSLFEPMRVIGTSAIDVSQYTKPEYNTIRFSLKDDDMSGLFYKFCEDIVEQTKDLKNKNEGYKAVTERFFQWKKMFVLSKSSLLTESQIMGLIGEILFLRGPLAKKIGLSLALKSWSGQELTHKDFSCLEKWYEIKTISNGSTSVKISSLEQLESDKQGELIVYVLEKMSSAYNGINLNNLIIETKELFDSIEDSEEFLTKVAMQGYEYNDYYDGVVFEISDILRYTITCDFPKLTHSNVPTAISKVSYDILLSDITSFKINEGD